MQALTDFWTQFSEFEYANHVLIGVGALLVLIGAMKIIRSGFRLAFWFLLAAIGVASASYGMERAEITLPPVIADRLEGIVKPGQNLSVGALQMLCMRLGNGDTSESGVLPPLE